MPTLNKNAISSLPTSSLYTKPTRSPLTAVTSAPYLKGKSTRTPFIAISSQPSSNHFPKPTRIPIARATLAPSLTIQITGSPFKAPIYSLSTKPTRNPTAASTSVPTYSSLVPTAKFSVKSTKTPISTATLKPTVKPIPLIDLTRSPTPGDSLMPTAKLSHISTSRSTPLPTASKIPSDSPIMNTEYLISISSVHNLAIREINLFFGGETIASSQLTLRNSSQSPIKVSVNKNIGHDRLCVVGPARFAFDGNITTCFSSGPNDLAPSLNISTTSLFHNVTVKEFNKSLRQNAFFQVFVVHPPAQPVKVYERLFNNNDQSIFINGYFTFKNITL